MHTEKKLVSLLSLIMYDGATVLIMSIGLVLGITLAFIWAISIMKERQKYASRHMDYSRASPLDEWHDVL